ncbi:MAG: 5-(carboxyamino)imidazole ribonucleotide synthase [Bacteroidota bacterium]|nr:5-(carboxyamino)imidazole ribonucleotide synthase [Bacteroidota bacterium]
MSDAKRNFPTIGILGGGQLGRMTALAAIRMGMHVKTLSPSPAGPVAALGEAVVGNWTDEDVMRDFIRGCDVITVESEWAPAEVAEFVSEGRVPVWPSSQTLLTIRHKGRQKDAFKSAGIPLGDYKNCTTRQEASEVLRAWGGKAVVKKFQGSYDGYGNATVSSEEELDAAWNDLSDEDGLLMEAFVPFVRELAVMVARRPSGGTVVYPVVETEQKDHRCHAVTAPARVKTSTSDAAREAALAAARAVNLVGMLGVELFELEDGTILLNEVAPRPHNTGHYSIEACHASQFENHARSILDLPLGSPDMRVPAAVMINVLGRRAGSVQTDGYEQALSHPDVAVHLYGKEEARPKRKMGHVTATGEDPDELRSMAEEAADAIHL